MGYYYLISSLPMLKSDGELPFEYNEFLEKCRSAVSDVKYEILKNLTLSSKEGPLVSRWAEFYCTLNQELIHQRNTRLGRPLSLSYQKDETAARIVTAVMNNKNPLEAEKMLLELEFEKLDELIGTHYFDDYALMGYAIKLKLLERKNIFEHELGKSELNRIVEGLEQQIISMG